MKSISTISYLLVLIVLVSGCSNNRTTSRQSNKMDVQKTATLVVASLRNYDSPLTTLNTKQQENMDGIIKKLKENKLTSAKKSWKRLIRSLGKKASNNSVNALIFEAIKESYIEQNEDLEYFARNLLAYNQVKSKIREHIAELNKLIKVCTTCFTTKKGNIKSEIKKWSERLKTVEADSSLASLELQSALQQQQKTAQLISQTSKMLHDTAKAIINKIR